MSASEQPKHEPSEHEAFALIRASGLVLHDNEARQLVTLHQRLSQKRATLAAVELGETEPLVIVVPAAEVR